MARTYNYYLDKGIIGKLDIIYDNKNKLGKPLP